MKYSEKKMNMLVDDITSKICSPFALMAVGNMAGILILGMFATALGIKDWHCDTFVPIVPMLIGYPITLLILVIGYLVKKVLSWWIAEENRKARKRS